MEGWYNMMFWMISDTHFHHNAIRKYCERPFDTVDEMDEEIIRRWNERVKPHDTVIHLGDFGFLRGEKNQEYYLNQLNGNLILLQGNHDNRSSIRTIAQCLVINYGGFDWWCQHHPSFQFKYNLCGHIHNLWKIATLGDSICVNVGVDVWGYRPVNMQEILREIDRMKKGEIIPHIFSWNK